MQEGAREGPRRLQLPETSDDSLKEAKPKEMQKRAVAIQFYGGSTTVLLHTY